MRLRCKDIVDEQLLRDCRKVHSMKTLLQDSELRWSQIILCFNSIFHIVCGISISIFIHNICV